MIIDMHIAKVWYMILDIFRLSSLLNFVELLKAQKELL